MMKNQRMNQNGKNEKFEESRLRAVCMEQEDRVQCPAPPPSAYEIKNTFFQTDFVLPVIELFEDW